MPQLIITLTYDSDLMLRRFPWPDEHPKNAIQRLVRAAEMVEMTLINDTKSGDDSSVSCGDLELKEKPNA